MEAGAGCAACTAFLSSRISNPPDHDRKRLLLAIPWPFPPNRQSQHGSDLPGDALARRRALWGAPCREFIRVIQNTETNSFELVCLLRRPIQTGLVSAAEHRRAARACVFVRDGGAAIRM